MLRDVCAGCIVLYWTWRARARNSHAKRIIDSREDAVATLVGVGLGVWNASLSETYSIEAMLPLLAWLTIRRDNADWVIRLAVATLFRDFAVFAIYSVFVGVLLMHVGYGNVSPEDIFDDTPATASDNPNKRIIVLTIGTRGDVQPFVALGVELKKLKCDVTIVTSSQYESMVTTRGLEFWDAKLALNQNYEKWQNATHVSEVMSISLPIFASKYETVSNAFLQACTSHAKPDLIIATAITTSIGYTLSEYCGCEFVVVKLAPDIPTKAYNSIGKYGALGALNYASWLRRWLLIISAAVKTSMGDVENEFRAKLGMPKVNGLKRLYSMFYATKTICAYSLVEHPRDYPRCFKTTGFWHLPVKNDAATRVTQKYDCVVTYGSMAAEERVKEMSAFLASCGYEVFVCESNTNYDHDTLFKNAKFVVHHGGAGTVAACARAGVFQVVDPRLEWTDQVLWGHAVEHLKIGVLLPPHHYEDLLRRALAVRPNSTTALRGVAETVRAENGAAAAAAALARILG